MSTSVILHWMLGIHITIQIQNLWFTAMSSYASNTPLLVLMFTTELRSNLMRITTTYKKEHLSSDGNQSSAFWECAKYHLQASSLKKATAITMKVPPWSENFDYSLTCVYILVFSSTTHFLMITKLLVQVRRNLEIKSSMMMQIIQREDSNLLISYIQ